MASGSGTPRRPASVMGPDRRPCAENGFGSRRPTHTRAGTDRGQCDPHNRGDRGRLRDELLDGEIFYTLEEARVVVESWRRHDNSVRPRASLGYKPPAPEVF